MFRHRIDLDRVAGRLREVQAEFPKINDILQSKRDTLSDEIVEQMLDGYRYVNVLLAGQVDVFKLGELHHLLELNNLVLCGTEPSVRRRFHRHIEATEAHFYNDEGGGIRDVMEWYGRHTNENAWRRAAGVYIRVLSEPQLFVEGNHRTGALIMSYILVREGCPPFVLSLDNAQGYFDPSTLVRSFRKYTMSMMLRMPGQKKYFAQFLREHTDRESLKELALA